MYVRLSLDHQEKFSIKQISTSEEHTIIVYQTRDCYMDLAHGLSEQELRHLQAKKLFAAQ